MFSSISGLQSDSIWLDVIGNNISNTNTVAYKASRVEFADQLSQSLSGGFGDNSSNGMGGQNPQQVGLGTRVASIQTLFAEGSTITTGISTDISIQGEGFLVAKSGDRTYLTRAGNLTFDSNGYLVDQNGGLIQGLGATIQYNKNIINSFSSVFGQPAVVTSADLELNNAAINNLTNIQINRDMTISPKATTQVTFKGNLDSFQQATQPGGIFDLNPGGVPILPLATMINLIGLPGALDTTRLTTQPLAGGGYALAQVQNLSIPFPGTNTPYPITNGILFLLSEAKAAGGNYAWDKQPPIPPAQQITENVYDSLGNPRQITVQFYQVNDLGAGGINNPNGPNQVCYAWYAFDTSGGKPVSTNNLLGGTGIGEGDLGDVFVSYDRGQFNTAFAGDFLWFNTDGSLASSGGIGGPPAPPGTPNFMSIPRVYLPPINQAFPVSPIPTQGAEITSIDLNFGTFGLLGIGKRDGVYSDAEGKYQIVNGVNTYVPKSTAYSASQNGYSDGILQGLNFDQAGVIQGTFSNGQISSLAQLVLAHPQNPEGLTKIGDNGFALSLNSGPDPIGLAGQGNLGKIQGGSLEGSNVDLTVELSNMIIAQRGFDTNSRMISVVNETLDVLSRLGQSQ